MVIEVVVYNIESAIQAQAGGADRIEVCDNPSQGGTTPSFGFIETVRRKVNIAVFVMIRPRGGDFLYSADEFDSMKIDIAQCKNIGVDGVVFGILNPDGTLDKKRCKELIDLARPLQVTCHRCFDMTPNPYQALEDCIEVGFKRILTSGQHSTAINGIKIIQKLIQLAEEKIVIMPGSEVNEQTVGQIIKQSKAKEIHFSATAFRESAMTYKNRLIKGMGTMNGNEFTLRTVDSNKIRKIRNSAEGINTH